MPWRRPCNNNIICGSNSSPCINTGECIMEISIPADNTLNPTAGATRVHGKSILRHAQS